MASSMAPVARTAPPVSKWARRARLLVVADQPESGQEDEHAIGGFTKNTHRQPGPPDKHAAEKDSDTGRKPGQGSPCAERLEAVSALIEAGGEDRERGRGHHGGAQTLNKAGADQGPRVLGQTAGHRGEREQGGAGDQDAAASEQVGGTSAEQQEPAVGEQVAAQHPLQVLDREVQIVANRGKRDIHDRGIDEVQERRRRTATPG